MLYSAVEYTPMIKILRYLTVVLFAPLLANQGLGQLAPLIQNVNARHTTDLDGRWQVIVDPYDVGALDYRAQPIKSNSAFFKNHKPQSESELVEYDFDTSGQLDVPGDWNTQRDSLLFYEGSVWYKRSFDYVKPANKRLFVHFGAANYQAWVYLNGEELGHHEGGFTPFDFEITDRVKPQGNFLILRINNTRGRDQVPTVNTDWWNYGGITRPVTLVEEPETFIQDYSIQFEKGSTRRIRGWIQLSGSHLQQKVAIRIPEAQVSQTFETDAKGRAEFSFDADLTLWSPENPKLYQVEIASDTDQVSDHIGFRSIEVRGTDILLNGKPVFLRGIDIHEEAPTRRGRAWTEDDARTLFGWAKELGCNFVRLAHYPHNEAMLRTADQTGIMVWGEVPVYWTIQWENPNTLRNATNQLNEMITRDHNRAALIIYSVANETPISDARNNFLRELIRDAHTTDPTRLVSAALQSQETTEGNRFLIHINDPIANDLDVMGNNEYIGWYVRRPEDADVTDWTSKYDKPLIMSEFGGDALFGLHGPATQRWTEEYQENLYRHQIAMLQRISFLRGTTPWILKDFRSPRRTLPRIQDYFNRKGLVSDRGEKKKAFFVMKQAYQDWKKAEKWPPQAPK
jgi:beta-glucuronidase